MIRAIAVDDEPLALELIESYCNKIDFLRFEKSFTGTTSALQYMKKNPVDLLFLDVNMPSMSGIDFFHSLDHKPLLIFTTSYSEYALKSYELGAVDYLLKPFSFERFKKAVERANDTFNLVFNARVGEKEKFLMLKADSGLIKVMLNDILFIEGLDNYLKIHLKDQSPIVIRLTMKTLMEMLNESEFLRVHRSYIVSISHIESIRQKMITIAGEEIPVGRNYEDRLKTIFNKE
jgi:DNA-binding LytR/AlgR family response regulator